MEQCFVGLDVSKVETSICISDENGDTVFAVEKATDPDAIYRALREHVDVIRCVVLETGRMANHEPKHVPEGSQSKAATESRADTN